MLFSFVKELNEETTELLEALRTRETLWDPNPRLVVWVFYIGEDKEVAKAWLKEHEIPGEVFSKVSPDAEGLEEWNLDAAKSNLFVLGGAGKTISASWADVTVEEMKGFGKVLAEAMK